MNHQISNTLMERIPIAILMVQQKENEKANSKAFGVFLEVFDSGKDKSESGSAQKMCNTLLALELKRPTS